MDNATEKRVKKDKTHIYEGEGGSYLALINHAI